MDGTRGTNPGDPGQTVRHPLHKIWSELPQDEPMPGLTRRRVIGENVMLSHVFLEKGCVVPSHAHENEQMAAVLSGRMRFRLGEDEATTIDVGAGELLHLPAMTPHAAEALEDSLVLDVFSPPSEATGIDRV